MPTDRIVIVARICLFSISVSWDPIEFYISVAFVIYIKMDPFPKPIPPIPSRDIEMDGN